MPPGPERPGPGLRCVQDPANDDGAGAEALRKLSLRSRARRRARNHAGIWTAPSEETECCHKHNNTCYVYRVKCQCGGSSADGLTGKSVDGCAICARGASHIHRKAPIPLRVKSELRCRFQPDFHLSSCSARNIPLHIDTDPMATVMSRLDRGATRRHGRCARDAVDAAMPKTDGVVADGEVVWSWRPKAGAKSRRCFRIARATVTTKPGHRGEREVSRKPLRREGRDASASPVVPAPCIFSRTGAMGVGKHPAFPAPSLISRVNCFDASGAIRAARTNRCASLGCVPPARLRIV